MKRLLPLILALGTLAACETTQQSTLTGAGTGAVLGAAVAGSGDRVGGALLGGVAGAVAGNLIGRTNQPGQCIYQYPNGERYRAAC